MRVDFRLGAGLDDAQTVAAELKSRYGGAVDRMALYLPYEHDSPDWRSVIEALRAV